MRFSIALPLAALLATIAPIGAFAQGPDGSDINKAIPIYFNQIVTDIGDSGTAPHRVYSITLAKGQQISATMTIPNGGAAKAMEIVLLEPTRLSVAGAGYSGDKGGLTNDYGTRTSVGFTYQVATTATYYVMVDFGSTGVNYSLQVKAQGTPIAVPNPPNVGCLTGRVDYITYSLQFIAAQLADEVSIGGQKACASCTVKAPLYPEIVTRLESALRSKVNVEACYDSTGSIFQIKLVQP